VCFRGGKAPTRRNLGAASLFNLKFSESRRQWHNRDSGLYSIEKIMCRDLRSQQSYPARTDHINEPARADHINKPGTDGDRPTPSLNWPRTDGDRDPQPTPARGTTIQVTILTKNSTASESLPG
jgi:hypothetical protein